MSWNRYCTVYFYNKGYRVVDNELLDESGNVRIKNARNGYAYFVTRLLGRNVHLMHHRIMAFHLYREDMFKDGILVRHLNGNRLDNYSNNIVLGTTFDNYYDIPDDIRKRGIYILRENNDRCVEINRVFDDKTSLEILKDRSSGYTYKNLCEKYNTSKSTLSYFFNDSKYVKSLAQ